MSELLNDELTLQIASILKGGLNQNQNSSSSSNLTIATKLNSTNYLLWARLMTVALGGRGRLNHITGDPEPPATEDPGFGK